MRLILGAAVPIGKRTERATATRRPATPATVKLAGANSAGKMRYTQLCAGAPLLGSISPPPDAPGADQDRCGHHVENELRDQRTSWTDPEPILRDNNHAEYQDADEGHVAHESNQQVSRPALPHPDRDQQDRGPERHHDQVRPKSRNRMNGIKGMVKADRVGNPEHEENRHEQTLGGFGTAA